MYLFITILVLIVSLILVLIVLVQNSKGGGLSSGFSSSNQIMGAPKTADFLEKATWSLAGALLFLCILSAYFIPRTTTVQQSELNGQIEAPAQNAGFEIGETKTPAQTQQAETEAAEAAQAPQEDTTK